MYRPISASTPPASPLISASESGKKKEKKNHIIPSSETPVSQGVSKASSSKSTLSSVIKRALGSKKSEKVAKTTPNSSFSASPVASDASSLAFWGSDSSLSARDNAIQTLFEDFIPKTNEEILLAQKQESYYKQLIAKENQKVLVLLSNKNLAEFVKDTNEANRIKREIQNCYLRLTEFQIFKSHSQDRAEYLTNLRNALELSAETLLTEVITDTTQREMAASEIKKEIAARKIELEQCLNIIDGIKEKIVAAEQELVSHAMHSSSQRLSTKIGQLKIQLDESLANKEALETKLDIITLALDAIASADYQPLPAKSDDLVASIDAQFNRSLSETTSSLLENKIETAVVELAQLAKQLNEKSTALKAALSRYEHAKVGYDSFDKSEPKDQTKKRIVAQMVDSLKVNVATMKKEAKEAKKAYELALIAMRLADSNLKKLKAEKQVADTLTMPSTLRPIFQHANQASSSRAQTRSHFYTRFDGANFEGEDEFYV